MQPAKRIEYVADPNKFDLIVHRWDSKGNRIGSPNYYRLHNKDHVNYYERPVDSGNLWFENNQPAGRIEYVEDGKGGLTKEIRVGAPHKEYVAPLTGSAKIASEVEQLRAKNEQLQREIAAIQKENEMRQAVQVGMPAADVKAGPPTLKKSGG